MESKFKKYDTVCMISGYKNYISNEYAGAGYEDIPGKKYKIISIQLQRRANITRYNQKTKTVVKGPCYIYFFDDHHNGVFEWVLYNTSSVRDDRLKLLGI